MILRALYGTIEKLIEQEPRQRAWGAASVDPAALFCNMSGIGYIIIGPLGRPASRQDRFRANEETAFLMPEYRQATNCEKPWGMVPRVRKGEGLWQR
jgi:hypothetical protein